MRTTLDVISGGRAVFGIGAAWFEAEHEAYGFRFPPLRSASSTSRTRCGSRARCSPRSARRSRAPTTASDGALNNPQPLRGDIPILIGGSGERKTLRLVAQYGDGCNLFGDVERVKHLLGVLDRHCEDVGRDPSEITRTRMAGVIIADTHEAADQEEAAAAGGRAA